MVSSEAIGLGEPMEAIVDKIETFMGQTLVTVTYTKPNALSGLGGCFIDVHITTVKNENENNIAYSDETQHRFKVELMASVLSELDVTLDDLKKEYDARNINKE